MLLFSANAKVAKMIFLILILWVGISEQRSPEVQLRPEVETRSAEVTVTSVQLERTEWSPTTIKIHEQSMHTQPEVTTQPTKPEVTVKPVVTETVIMSKPEVKPSETTKLIGVSIRGARPDYNEDGTVNTFGQYIGGVSFKDLIMLII